MPAGMTRYVYCPDCQSMTQPSTGRHICSRYKEGQLVNRISKTWNHALNCWEVAKEETSDNRRDASVEGPMRDVYHPVLKQVDASTFIRAPEKTENRAEAEKKTVDLEKREMSWDEYLEAKYGPQKKTEKEEDYEYSSCELPPRTAVHERKCLCLECRPKHIKYHPDSCKCWECYTWKRGKGHDVSYEPHNYQNNYGPYGANYKPYKPVKPFEGVDRTKWPNTFINLLKLYFSTGEWYAGKTISDEDYRDRILHQKYKPEPKYNYHYGSYYDHDGA